MTKPKDDFRILEYCFNESAMKEHNRKIRQQTAQEIDKIIFDKVVKIKAEFPEQSWSLLNLFVIELREELKQKYLKGVKE